MTQFDQLPSDNATERSSSRKRLALIAMPAAAIVAIGGLVGGGLLAGGGPAAPSVSATPTATATLAVTSATSTPSVAATASATASPSVTTMPTTEPAPPSAAAPAKAQAQAPAPTPAKTSSTTPTRVKDSCPNGDYSGSSYDGKCGTKPAATTSAPKPVTGGGGSAPNPQGGSCTEGAIIKVPSQTSSVIATYKCINGKLVKIG